MIYEEDIRHSDRNSGQPGSPKGGPGARWYDTEADGKEGVVRWLDK